MLHTKESKWYKFGRKCLPFIYMWLWLFFGMSQISKSCVPFTTKCYGIGNIVDGNPVNTTGYSYNINGVSKYCELTRKIKNSNMVPTKLEIMQDGIHCEIYMRSQYCFHFIVGILLIIFSLCKIILTIYRRITFYLRKKKLYRLKREHNLELIENPISEPSLFNFIFDLMFMDTTIREQSIELVQIITKK